MKLWKHIRAIGLLPFVVAVVVPASILARAGRKREAERAPAPLALGRAALGGVFLAGGLLLIVKTVRLFAEVGKGTLAPWDPTERLVAQGPYRYVRNPMISGVLFVLLGEAAVFGSVPLLIWASFFFLVNAVYIPLNEEPGLRKRFGASYRRYEQHVPRWIPRLHPWEGAEA